MHVDYAIVTYKPYMELQFSFSYIHLIIYQYHI